MKGNKNDEKSSKTISYEKWLKLLIISLVWRLYEVSWPLHLDHWVCGMKDLRFFIFLAEPHPIGGFKGRKCQLDILNKFLVERTVQKQNELISLFFTCVTPNMSSPHLPPPPPATNNLSKSYLSFKTYPMPSSLHKLFPDYSNCIDPFQFIWLIYPIPTKLRALWK